MDCAMEVRAMVNTFPFGSDFVQLRQAMQELLQIRQTAIDSIGGPENPR